MQHKCRYLRPERETGLQFCGGLLSSVRAEWVIVKQIRAIVGGTGVWQTLRYETCNRMSCWIFPLFWVKRFGPITLAHKINTRENEIYIFIWLYIPQYNFSKFVKDINFDLIYVIILVIQKRRTYFILKILCTLYYVEICWPVFEPGIINFQLCLRAIFSCQVPA